MGDFSNQINRFNEKFRSRYRATARTAVQETVSLAQRVKRRGGRMRVDTGFLRASIQGNINSMPIGPTENKNDARFKIGEQSAGENIALTILRWDPVKEDSLFIGWTANYARPREYFDGFLRGAVELWDRTVDTAARKVRKSGL